MSRHRNVRSLNYSDEYDGYDDEYGQSVEDEYCISPSDAAQFMYDRNRQSTQISAFFDESDNIAEENETEESIGSVRRSSDTFQKPHLSELEEVRLQSCLDEIRNVIGDTIPENIIIETILKNSFDLNKSLDALLSYEPSASKSDDPKPQRERKDRNRGSRITPAIPQQGAEEKCSQQSQPELPVKVIPSNANAANVTKGFEVHYDTSEKENSVRLNADTGGGISQSQSPEPEALPQQNGDREDTADIKNQAVKDVNKTTRIRAKLDVVAQYQQDRGKSKEQLHMVVIGHVDAGKSTLMGHLLYSLGQVNKKTMHKYEQETKKIGKQSFLYAWILDETGEERSRGITMDVGQSKFETPNRVITLLDAPGHKDFIPNMITGATQADVALLVVDATRGEFETGFESGGQTREHALLVRSLGVSQLCVVVNKLDTVEWSQERFQEITGKLGSFLRQAGFRESDVTFVPCSGLTGENLVTKPKEEKLNKWYNGPCLVEAIDKFKPPERPITKPFRLSVNDIFKGTGSGFCVSGKVETGVVQVGDKLLVLPHNEAAQVKALTIDDAAVQTAYAGDNVSVTLQGVEMQNVSIGDILSDPVNVVPVTSRFEARIVVFNIKVPITKGCSVILHHQSLLEPAVITKLVAQLHKSTGEVIKRHPRCLVRNSNALVQLETSRPICMELYKDIKELGRFMLRVGGVTVAAGLVTQIF
ncbi:protein HBS1 isoform X1 [Schistocerca serialis cubense]|uniref:protein HBS1 isoform X1 n=1 Tax=Schistocerca serialis cubense TaxID=2023355 RepID=UPI00214EE416|nr:protein HBS1 isoform X1 [Schistocerca serialis cubense]